MQNMADKFKVSDSVRARVESTAREVCKALGIGVSDFSQLACALTANNALATTSDKAERLMVLYVCSNASALRQKLESESSPKVGSIAADLLKLAK